jgi:hypothetical protein
MVYIMKKIKLILLLLLIGYLKSYSQDFSKSSLFVGVGVGSSNNSRAVGLGINGTIGYQRSIWNNRLQAVPSFSFGTYSHKAIDDVPDAFYSSTNLKLNLNFDIFKVKAFSLFVGSGVAANYSSGLIGTGGDTGRNTSEYFNQFNLAVNGLLGLKLNPAKNRIGYELLLIDGSFNNNFSEISILKLRVTMKLK